jgi:enoyl-CoA hydratase/carnithine racemase
VRDPDDFSDLTSAVDDNVAVITLCRPERRNAFTGAMGASLGAAYRRCDEDDGVRAVVVTGAGDAFCAGADVAPAGETFAVPVTDPGEFTSSPVRPPAWEVRMPVLAAMNGHAIGIGMALAMQCDLRIMATGAKYGFVHVRRGVIPDAHSHWTVPRAVGFSQAADLLLPGRHFNAEEAVAMGLATRAVAREQVLAPRWRWHETSPRTPHPCRSRSRSGSSGPARRSAPTRPIASSARCTATSWEKPTHAKVSWRSSNVA